MNLVYTIGVTPSELEVCIRAISNEAEVSHASRDNISVEVGKV